MSSCGYRRWGWIVAVALLVWLPGTGRLPLLDRDEPRFAEAAREMRERADWVVPYFNHTYRFDKPPLIYWAQWLSYRVLGESDFSARLPSVVASVLTALVVYAMGTRMYGEKAGFWAALVFTTSFQMLAHGRLAVADPLLLLWVALSIWSGWEWLAGNEPDRPDARPRKPLWGWVFFVSQGLAFLAKGPVGWLPFVAMLSWRWLTPGARAPRHLWAGAALTLSLVALWGVPALERTNGQFLAVGLGKHVIGRTVGVMEGHGGRTLVTYLAALPFFFVTFFVSFAPWAWWVPSLLRSLRSAGHRWDLRDRWLALNVILIFGVFTLSRTKLPHYTLPAFPALAVWFVGRWLSANRPVSTLRRGVLSVVGLNLLLSTAGFHLARPHFPVPQLTTQCLPWLGPDTAFATVNFDEPSVVWYFRKHTRAFRKSLSPSEAPDFMAQAGPRICILASDQVPAVFPRLAPDWRVVQVEGINVVQGRWIRQSAVIKPK